MFVHMKYISVTLPELDTAYCGEHECSHSERSFYEPMWKNNYCGLLTRVLLPQETTTRLCKLNTIDIRHTILRTIVQGVEEIYVPTKLQFRDWVLKTLLQWHRVQSTSGGEGWPSGYSVNLSHQDPSSLLYMSITWRPEGNQSPCIHRNRFHYAEKAKRWWQLCEWTTKTWFEKGPALVNLHNIYPQHTPSYIPATHAFFSLSPSELTNVTSISFIFY